MLRTRRTQRRRGKRSRRGGAGLAALAPEVGHVFEGLALGLGHELPYPTKGVTIRYPLDR